MGTWGTTPQVQLTILAIFSIWTGEVLVGTLTADMQCLESVTLPSFYLISDYFILTQIFIVSVNFRSKIFCANGMKIVI